MKNQALILICSFFLALTAAAQSSPPLMIKGYGKDLYIDHKVAPKEGIFAIGRMYNVHPKFIAAYNKLDMSKGLSIGQVLRIPLTDTNFSQKNINGRPVYYKVGDKESLAKISSVNNKVPAQSLRDWNRLKNDNVPTGTNLVVGYLVSGVNSVTTTAAPPAKDEIKNPEENKLTIKKDSVADKSKTVGKKDDLKKTEPVTVKKDTSSDKSKTAMVKKDDSKREEVKKDEPKKSEPIVSKREVTNDMSGQGYFKSSFDQQVKTAPLSKTETVTSGVFKMGTMLSEAKYYLLADGVSPGTVIRVINPENNKTVYAKVLGEMSGVRQNAGLNIRISDTAASALGINDTDKFIVKINY